jgi:hypothetical protein
LDDRAATALIEQRNSSAPVRVAASSVEWIKEVTGRQPYLLQRLCQRLYQSDHSLRAPTESDLDVDELLGSLYHADFRSLLGDEAKFLWLIVDTPGEDMSALQVMTGLDAARLNSCLFWLGCLGFVQRRRRRFFVADRFLTSWLLSNREALAEAGLENAQRGTPVPSHC